MDNLCKLKKKTDREISMEDAGILFSAATRKEREIDLQLNVNAIGLDVVGENTDTISKAELKQEQQQDKVIGEVYRFVERKEKVKTGEMKMLSKEVKIMLRQFKKLVIVDGVLKRETAKFSQIVLPEKFRRLVYDELHG